MESEMGRLLILIRAKPPDGRREAHRGFCALPGWWSQALLSEHKA